MSDPQATTLKCRLALALAIHKSRPPNTHLPASLRLRRPEHMASLKNALDRALKTVTRSPPAPDEELHDQAQPAEPADGSLRISELEAEIVRLKEMLFTAAQTSTATATDPDRFRGGDAKGRSEDEGGMGPLGSPIVMVSQRQRTRRQIEQPEGRKKRRLMSVSSEEGMDRGASGLDGKDQFAIT